jgi:hypothetical protein
LFEVPDQLIISLMVFDCLPVPDLIYIAKENHISVKA